MLTRLNVATLAYKIHGHSGAVAVQQRLIISLFLLYLLRYKMPTRTVPSTSDKTDCKQLRGRFPTVKAPHTAGK